MKKDLMLISDKVAAFSNFAWNIWRWIGLATLLLIAWYKTGKWGLFAVAIVTILIPAVSVYFRFLAFSAGVFMYPEARKLTVLALSAFIMLISLVVSVYIIMALLAVGIAAMGA